MLAQSADAARALSAGRGGKARVRLTGLDADVFRHPLDRQAAQSLKRVPGFDKAVAKFIEWGWERKEYIELTASGVRVGPRQLPRVHGLLRETCAVLDIPEPELYVRKGPTNAYTSGHNNPYIVLFTELVDTMSEDELLAVIAHEAGHIKCGHVLHKTMARVFTGAATAGLRRTNPMTAIVGVGVRAALKSYDRASEFTADRAAMLTTQDLHACVGMMMKIAGGVQTDQMDTTAFLEQARHLDDLASASNISRFHRFQLRIGGDHPLLVERARRFDEWIMSGQPGVVLARYGTTAVPTQPTDGVNSLDRYQR
ncbi:MULTISPECIES: M48 family metallopeptidase [unclassified Frankia]|uniref:M48 family metallopeptidase n=1 Tax=unclassified Frankia TaxID=2632575 RepID=UPI002025B59C